MDFGFTWFDFAALVVLGLSGVMAFARGLIREVFSIIAFIGGLLAAAFLFLTGLLQGFVEGVTPLRGLTAILAGGLFVFLVVFILITLVTSSIAKTAHQSTEIGSFDRAAGLGFGILRGILFVAVFFVLPIRLMPSTEIEEPNPFREGVVQARTYPIYASVASVLEAMAPQARARARVILERRQGESAPIPPDQPESAPAPEPDAEQN